MGAHAGSDKRAVCVCTGKPAGQTPVGAHQSEVSTVGKEGGRKRKWRRGVMGQSNGNGLQVMTMGIFLGGEQVGGVDCEGSLFISLWVRNDSEFLEKQIGQ